MKKKIITIVGLVAALFLLAYLFVPDVLSGKVVDQVDTFGWRGMAAETLAWNAEHHDDPAYWSDSMFGGMPTVTFMSPTKGDWTQKIYNLLLKGKAPASMFFISLLGAFLMLLAFGVNPWIAAGGAIAVTFCTYNSQIIQVGHSTKMLAIAFTPWAVGAFVFTYRNALRRRKWLLLTLMSAALFGLAISFQVKSNHPQISYYLALMLIIYAIVEFIWVCRDKERRSSFLGRFLAASGLLVVMGLAGIGTNAIKLLPTMEYSGNSTRGGSTDKSGGEGSAKGLELDYATAWSYGVEELPNLLIPDYNGGSSHTALDPVKSAVGKTLRRAQVPDARELCKMMPLYWGPQPYTAGPMYMGAITVFLFLMGLFCYKGREKWWALAATILAVCLSLGYHMLWFTRLFYEYAPLYNKFRTVSMALVTLQVTLPVLGFLMLDSIVKDTSRSPKELRRMLLGAGGITVGFCLLLSVIQWIFGAFTSYADEGIADALVAALQSDRISHLWMDTLRSVILIAGSAAILCWGVSYPKSAVKTFETNPDMAHSRRLVAAALVCVLVLADMFTVSKRYLNSSHFMSRRTFENKFNKRPVDDAILQDTCASFRVLDLSAEPFNSAVSSVFHKNIGGYSAAKLQRYQEFIDAKLSGEIDRLKLSLKGAGTIAEGEAAMPYLPGLAALNLKYVILSDNLMLEYRHGRGPAWFEDRFEGYAQLLSYSPNCLEYSYTSLSDNRIVFSEIYYPSGWKLTLEDGTDIPIELYVGDGDVPGGVFRSAVVPEGRHTLTMRYDPPSYRKGEAISRACSILLILITLLSAAGVLVDTVKKKES